MRGVRPPRTGCGGGCFPLAPLALIAYIKPTSMTQDGTGTYKIIGGDHKEYGPATAAEVQQWIVDGRVSGQTLVQIVGSREWKPLSSLDEFGEDLKAQALRFGGPLPQASATPDVALPETPAAAGQTELRVGACLAGSARLFGANFGLIAGACMLLWLLALACQFIPFIGGILYWFLQGPLYGGLYIVFLKRIRGEPASMGEVFTGFGPQFMQLSLAGFLITLLTSIGYFICFIPGLYLTVAWAFAIPAAAEKRLEFWSAMELSRRVATRAWFKVAVLLLLAFLPVVLMHIYSQVKIFSTTYPLLDEVFRSGQPPDLKRLQGFIEQVSKVALPLLLTSKVVLLFNLPFAVGAVAHAYEVLFGTRSAAKD